MNDKYKIVWFTDRIYGVYFIEDEVMIHSLFQGTLPEVESYLSLKEKGFNL